MLSVSLLRKLNPNYEGTKVDNGKHYFLTLEYLQLLDWLAMQCMVFEPYMGEMINIWRLFTYGFDFELTI